MSVIQKPSCASGSSRRRREKPDGAVEDAACQQPNLSHIAPGLRPLAVPVAELSLMVGNPRSHPTKNLEAIKAALVDYGQVETILVNRRKQPWEVIHGNGRLQAALELGWSHVAANIVDVDDTVAKAMAVVLNRTGELAEWNKEELDKLLREVQTSGKLDAMLAELAQEQGIQLAAAEGLTDPDEIPEPPDQPKTKRGDLWVLGNHRLLCGDAGSADDVDRLLAGAPVHLVNCDPPYGVCLEPRSNNAIASGSRGLAAPSRKAQAPNHQGFDLVRNSNKSTPTTKKMRPKDRPLQNDFLSDEEFTSLLRSWFGNLARVLLPGRAFYIWGGWSNLADYPTALEQAGLFWHQQIIWVKNAPVLCRKDYMLAHEWCFYGWRAGAAHQFFGASNIRDVWEVSKVPSQKMVHLTEKPVELAVRAMQYSSRTGENVLDLFGGSGSTLIGAEQVGRKAFLMEVDGLYCDVIVARYESFTGRKAKLARA